MAKIGISCKASFSQGMGHVIRQSHIAKILRDRGHEITFFVPDYPPARHWLDQCGLPHQVSIDQETDDLIILDIQDTTADHIQNFRQNNNKVVSFEDLGEGRNHVDLLIDCNLAEEKSAELPSHVQTLFGNKYAVLAPEFEAYHDKEREFKDPIASVLLTFGGTDPHSLTATLAEKLLQIQPNLCMTLLAGPGCENTPALKNLQTQNVKLLGSTSEMAKMLFAHDAVFCSGGVTLHEAMAVGTPAFVINQVKHQAVKANHAEKYGAAMNLGMADCWNENRLPEILKSSPETLERMSRAGKSMIDGKGLLRVVEAIEKLFSQ